MKRVLVLAHREELIYQARQHAKRAGYEAGIEMGNLRARNELVVVSTVQTLNSHKKNQPRRMERFDPHEFGLVITDEGHHATATSYRRVYQWFKQNPDCRFLFVTATPHRSDEIGLHNVCESVAYEMELRQAIDLGWLCPIRQRFVQVDEINLSEVSTKNSGDLADGELERVFVGGGDQRAEYMAHKIMKPTIDQANGSPFIVFASGCDHAELLTKAGNSYSGVRCELVLGSTDKQLRRQIIQRYKSHETQGLINVGVATEGFDAPAAEVVAIARPTKSESLYCQMIGRVTRPLPGVVDGLLTAAERIRAIANSEKPQCVVLDFVGNSGRHKLVSLADVLAGEDVDERDLLAAVELSKKQEQPVNIDAMIEEAKQQREELEERLRQAKQNRERRLEEEEDQRYEPSRYYAHQADYTLNDVDLFDGHSFDPLRDYTPSPGGATPKQVKYLMSLGVRAETAIGYTKRQAGAVITRKKNASGGEFIMPFGKHKGKKLRDIPSGYREWMKQNIQNAEIQQHLEQVGR